MLLVTGSGRRLRQIKADPLAAVGALRIDDGGTTATLHTAPQRLFERLTSELNSHLAVHDDHVRRLGGMFHAVVHAQPPHLTCLSHIPEYRDPATMNHRILRWEPELIVALPEGVAVLEFMVPGSDELMAADVEALRTHQIVLWGKHGVMARSDLSVTRAVDRVEYETGARYEDTDIVAGGRGKRLTDDELRRVAAAFSVESPCDRRATPPRPRHDHGPRRRGVPGRSAVAIRAAASSRSCTTRSSSVWVKSR